MTQIIDVSVSPDGSVTLPPEVGHRLGVSAGARLSVRLAAQAVELKPLDGPDSVDQFISWRNISADVLDQEEDAEAG